MLKEIELKGLSGWLMVFVLLLVLVILIFVFLSQIEGQPVIGVISLLLFVICIFCFKGLTVVNPNEACVIQLFGKYKGTLKNQGFLWVNPLTMRRRVSVRIRNFESGKLKVNDHDGNPIEIAAVVVWRVIDTAEAIFEVDEYENFVHVQSEAAVRNLATSYPYDAHTEGQISLRMSSGDISKKLQEEIQERLAKAGMEVMEARISHLAYAPEIASAMLRRQQASAIIAARQKIVEGAVSMVQMALDQLNEKEIVHLDEERKASMVSNLLVVLCSDKDTQPVVNTGTLYQ